MFSISRERARQIEGNVIRKLRTELEQTDIAPDLPRFKPQDRPPRVKLTLPAARFFLRDAGPSKP